MRTKQLIHGLNNTQKIRFIVDGVGMHCKVQDISNIATTKHRVAVWRALETLSMQNYALKDLGRSVTGYGTTYDGVQVQVDLL